MRKCLYLFLAMCLPALAQQQYKIAIVGLVHSHVWGHLGTMLKGGPAKLVGVSDPHPDLVAEVKKDGAQKMTFDDAEASGHAPQSDAPDPDDNEVIALLSSA